ncbi:MAG: energy transducer TonB [Pararheinheimera sp.]|nr:energy transducer TonB [Rheinheimera sp.]
MLKQLLVSSALLMSFLVKADLYQATQLYQQQKYQEAKREFEQLLPLGNEMAAFNLAVMAMNAQGMEQDLPRSYSYYLVADKLGHPNARRGISYLDSVLSAEQKQQAQQQADAWQQTFVPSLESSIKARLQSNVDNADKIYRRSITRVEPKYPKAAARKLTQGFAVVRLLVNEHGSVDYAKTQHSFPPGVFAETSEHALKQWRYEATGQKSIVVVTMDFGLTIPAHDMKSWRYNLTKALEKDYWPGAVAGVALHQYYNAILLNYLSRSSDNRIDFSTTATKLPELADFPATSAQALEMQAFDGKAEFSLDQHHKLSKVVVFSGEVPLTAGQVFSSTLKAGDYFIAPWDLNFGTDKPPVYAKDKMYVKPLHYVPKEWSSAFWEDQAARNGLLEAQRARAQFDRGWASYLRQKNDPVALGWHAIELLTEQKSNEAKAVFKQAQAAGFEATPELEVLFQ